MSTETSTTRHSVKCPSCGSSSRLYGRADCRWDEKLESWIIGDMETEIECTACDWSGDQSELIEEAQQ